MVSKITNKHIGRIKSEEKRQQMLDAAANLFLTLGFEKTSMDQVAIDANVSKQTVYSHFGNKDTLFSSVIEVKCINNTLSEELFNQNLPVIDILQELAMRFTELILSEEAVCVKRACVAETPQRIKVAKLFWEAGPSRLTKQFAKYLSDQNTLGNVHIKNPHFAAQQFLYMLSAEAESLTFFDQPNQKSIKELPEYIKSCIELFKKSYID